MTYDTEKVDWRCRILSILPLLLVNPAPSLALIILPSSHYYHNHIANKITIQQIRQKTRVVLHINHISHHRHRPLSLYRPPHRSSPSSATTYNQQRLSSTTYKYSTKIYNLSHPYTKTTTPRRYDHNPYINDTKLSIKYLPCQTMPTYLSTDKKKEPRNWTKNGRRRRISSRSRRNVRMLCNCFGLVSPKRWQLI